ncbi:hypothetical protein BO71DRAFT_456488 [Aspergillus ellipticus CBS 707.79]|uniref:Uncharacterized protein n=1 Tax=Aspergillus ellipticus CBS 707.79 TaxID=1448320 RepID=A0A319D5U7_9EURO|nr:hypothetical protein BO71DRAFT_456488 [Aspergillus ellipticus CBS 707.79]
MESVASHHRRRIQERGEQSLRFHLAAMTYASFFIGVRNTYEDPVPGAMPENGPAHELPIETPQALHRAFGAQSKCSINMPDTGFSRSEYPLIGGIGSTCGHTITHLRLLRSSHSKCSVTKPGYRSRHYGQAGDREDSDEGESSLTETCDAVLNRLQRCLNDDEKENGEMTPQKTVIQKTMGTGVRQ